MYSPLGFLFVCFSLLVSPKELRDLAPYKLYHWAVLRPTPLLIFTLLVFSSDGSLSG